MAEELLEHIPARTLNIYGGTLLHHQAGGNGDDDVVQSVGHVGQWRGQGVKTRGGLQRHADKLRPRELRSLPETGNVGIPNN